MTINYISNVKLLQHFLQLRKLLWAACWALAGRIRPVGCMLCRPVLVFQCIINKIAHEKQIMKIFWFWPDFIQIFD